MQDFVATLKLLLVEEFKRTPEDAERLVKTYTDVVVHGIMRGPVALRACAMSLEMKESEDRRGVDPTNPNNSASTNTDGHSAILSGRDSGND